MKKIIITESQLARIYDKLVEFKVLDGDDSTKPANGFGQVSTEVPIHNTDGELDQDKTKPTSTDKISHTLAGLRNSEIRRY